MRKILCLLVLALFTLSGSAQSLFTHTSSETFNEEGPNGSIQGTIATTDNQPAASVTIYLKGTGKAAISDESGNFSIRNIKPGIYILLVSMTGLQSQEKAVEVKEDKITTVSFTLTEDAKLLSAVIVNSQKSFNDKTVSAGKIAIDPMDLPQSIAVVGQGLIREQQAQRLGDVVKNVNGVYVTTTRGNVQESFGARGYGFGSKQPV